MYCSKCGAKLPDTAQFCSQCGAPTALHAADGTGENKTMIPAVGSRAIVVQGITASLRAMPATQKMIRQQAPLSECPQIQRNPTLGPLRMEVSNLLSSAW